MVVLNKNKYLSFLFYASVVSFIMGFIFPFAWIITVIGILKYRSCVKGEVETPINVYKLAIEMAYSDQKINRYTDIPFRYIKHSFLRSNKNDSKIKEIFLKDGKCLVKIYKDPFSRGVYMSTLSYEEGGRIIGRLRFKKLCWNMFGLIFFAALIVGVLLVVMEY